MISHGIQKVCFPNLEEHVILTVILTFTKDKRRRPLGAPKSDSRCQEQTGRAEMTSSYSNLLYNPSGPQIGPGKKEMLDCRATDVDPDLSCQWSSTCVLKVATWWGHCEEP